MARAVAARTAGSARAASTSGVNLLAGACSFTGPTQAMGTSGSSVQTPSERSRVKGYAALCVALVREGGPKFATSPRARQRHPITSGETSHSRLRVGE